MVVDSEGRKIIMGRSLLLDSNNIENERYKVPYDARLIVDESDKVST